MEKRIFEALGGECEIYAIDLPPARLAEGETWVHEMHDRLTRFSPTSELSRFNASAGSWVAVSALLESLLRERTAFVIAHRLSTVLGADKILVVSDGRILERGRHEELLRRGGMYARLYEMQFCD